MLHRKYQVNSHSCQRFLAAGTATIAFVCTNRINTLHLKWNSDKLVIVSKEFLKLLNLHMLIKQKSLSLPWNLALTTICELLMLVFTKVNLLDLLCFTSVSCCFLLPIKKFFEKNFSKNSNLDDLDIFLSA